MPALPALRCLVDHFTTDGVDEYESIVSGTALSLTVRFEQAHRLDRSILFVVDRLPSVDCF